VVGLHDQPDLSQLGFEVETETFANGEVDAMLGAPLNRSPGATDGVPTIRVELRSRLITAIHSAAAVGRIRCPRLAPCSPSFS
jgi:hypothetical protein